MKFGVLQFFSWPGRRGPLETVYERAFERMMIMEETGYDAVWLAEHHFSTYSVCPSVHIMGTHIAAHTKRLRIGTAVSLAPFYHPLRLAEEVALLDHVSGGRVNWGAGRGFDPTEHRAFGVEPKDSYGRFRECFEIVLKCWNNERLTHHGEFWQFDDIEVLPKPKQDPMPVWLATGSSEAIIWAAERGHSILLGPHATRDESSGKVALFKSTLEAAGYSATGRQTPIARALANKQQVVVADEPTGSLDPKTAASVMELLLEMCREEEVTMLMVTHDKTIADSLPERFDCTELVREVSR